MPSTRIAPLMTRKRFLLMQAMLYAPWYIAVEAVATTALEHPEWDMSEEKTYDQWRRSK